MVGVNTGESNVKLTLYNMLGREIIAHINEQLNAGTYEAEWNAVNSTSGVYYRLTAGDFKAVKKMGLVK